MERVEYKYILIFTVSLMCSVHCSEVPSFEYRFATPDTMLVTFFYESCYFQFSNITSELENGPKRQRQRSVESLSHFVENRQLSCYCDNTKYVFRWDEHWSESPFSQVRLVYRSNKYVDGMDSFLPLSRSQLGKSYQLVFGEKPHSRSWYVSIINVSHIKHLVVSILISSSTSLGETETTTMHESIPLNDVRVLESTVTLKGGVQLSSDDVFAVVSGIVGTDNGVEPVSRECHAVEMFPPECFFSNYYVVPFLPHWLNTSVIILQSIGNLTQMIIVRCGTGKSDVHKEYFYNERGSPIYINQTDVVAITSSHPVIVVQQHRAVLSSEPANCAFTILPPVRRWSRSALLYPLQLSKEERRTIVHFAVIIINAMQANDIRIFRPGLEDAKIPVTFQELELIGYSQAYIRLSEDLYLVEHPSAEFQLIQFGWAENSSMVYASPVTLTFDVCIPEDVSNTSTSDDSDPPTPMRTMKVSAGKHDKDDLNIVGVLLCFFLIVVNFALAVVIARRQENREKRAAGIGDSINETEEADIPMQYSKQDTADDIIILSKANKNDIRLNLGSSVDKK